MMVSLFAILNAGPSYLPIDPDYPAERVAFMLADAEPAFLITTTELAISLPENLRRLSLDQTERVDALEDSATRNPGNRGRSRPLRSNNSAYVIYTSGSTGKPKGVVITHGGIPSLAAAQIEHFAITPVSRILQFASISFDASFSEIVISLLSGATLLLLDNEERSADVTAETMHKYGVTHVTLPPVVVADLAEDRQLLLDTLIVAGEACHPEVLARRSEECKMVNAYGPTETTVCATISAPLSGRVTA